MRIALFEPDIAGNVGTVLRLGACLGVGIDLIEPMGFAWSDRALARAGLDYAGSVDVVRYVDWEAFRGAVPGRLVLLTTKGAVRLGAMTFEPSDTLLLGSEGSGVPPHVHAAADARVVIPMRSGMRSLNVAVAGAIVLGEALRQVSGWPGSDAP